MRLKIVADNSIPFLKGIAEPEADVVYLDAGSFNAAAVRDADALIIRSIDKCTPTLLEGSSVKLITTATIGYDHIDTAFCEHAGITWKNAPGCNAESVAEYLLSSLITIALRNKEPLAGKTIGIVGVGHVGKNVERLCRAFDMKVLLNDPPRAEEEGDEGFVSLDTVAEQSDIITFHVPLTREGKYPTYHLANDLFFSKCCHRPWFINSCRGAVNDTDALLRAHKDGFIGEMLIDCWENEPHIRPELLHEAAIATPHIAGFSADGKANGTRISLEHIQDFFHVKFSRLKEVVPPEPLHPTIDLVQFKTYRIENAICTAFSPLESDKLLRETPEQFEYFRSHYPHPREFAAYTIAGGTIAERVMLGKLGFRMS